MRGCGRSGSARRGRTSRSRGSGLGVRRRGDRVGHVVPGSLTLELPPLVESPSDERAAGTRTIAPNGCDERLTPSERAGAARSPRSASPACRRGRHALATCSAASGSSTSSIRIRRPTTCAARSGSTARSTSPAPAGLARGRLARHRLLRSTFQADGDSAIQVVHDRRPLVIERIAAARRRRRSPAATRQPRARSISSGVRSSGPRWSRRPSGDGRSPPAALCTTSSPTNERSSSLWREIADAYAAVGAADAPAASVRRLRPLGSARRTRRRDRGPRGTGDRGSIRCPTSLRLPFERPAAPGGSGPSVRDD